MQYIVYGIIADDINRARSLKHRQQESNGMLFLMRLRNSGGEACASKSQFYAIALILFFNKNSTKSSREVESFGPHPKLYNPLII